MKFRIPLKASASFIACMFLFSVMKGQNFSFRNYGAEFNIPNRFVYTINQSNDGYLWIGTGNGIARFDGFNFYNVPFPDTSASRNPNASFKDKNGTLWFGCSDGTVYYAKDKKLIQVKLSNTKSITEILPGPDGLIYIIPQGSAIYSVNPDKPEEIHEKVVEGDNVILSATFSENGDLLLGSQGTILVCNLAKDTVTVNETIEGFDYSAITSILKTDDSQRYIIGTEDNGLFLLRHSANTKTLTRFHDHPEFSSLRIKSISEDSAHNVWVCTIGSGVMQFQLSGDSGSINSLRLFNSDSGLGSNDTKLVFQDSEGNYWFGLFGEGISMLTSNAFAYYTPGKTLLKTIYFLLVLLMINIFWEHLRASISLTLPQANLYHLQSFLQKREAPRYSPISSIRK